MTNEEFLRDVCPNHTDKSQWNKSELLHILELHEEQLRLHFVVGRSEQLPILERCGCEEPNEEPINVCMNCNGYVE